MAPLDKPPESAWQHAIAADDSLLARTPRGALVAGCALLVAGVGLFDFVTGPDLELPLLYLLPIMACAWHVGRRAGVLIATLAASVMLFDEVALLTEKDKILIALANAVLRLGIFGLVAALLSRLHESLRHESELARTDGLTGIANARTFYAALERALEEQRVSAVPVTVLNMDLDNFKLVNDTMGHHAGDAVLRLVAETLRDETGPQGLVARLGGDEFGIVASGLTPAEARRRFTRLHAALLRALSSRGLPVSASAGVLTFVEPPRDAETALRRADDLMYSVKAAGKSDIAFQSDHEEPTRSDGRLVT